MLIESSMDGDLSQRNLVDGIDPDQGDGGSPDGSGRGRLADDQIGGKRRLGERLGEWLRERLRELRELRERERERRRELEREKREKRMLEQDRELLQRLLLPRLSLPQRRLLPLLSLPHLVQFFNRGPASAAVNGGELMTGDIQLHDGRVGRGDGIGYGFGANDQEQSSASINGELGTTYVRASDDFRHMRTENGEVRVIMNSFVDGRVYNLTQEPHLTTPGSSQLINKVMLAITGQTGVALMVAALNDHSSPFPPAFYFVVAANTVGFITTMISMLLRTRKPWASGVLAKVGAVAASSAIILAMGMALHMRHIWAFVFLCIIAAVVVLFGQT